MHKLTKRRLKHQRMVSNMLEQGNSQSDVARLLGVSRQRISQVVLRTKAEQEE